MKRETLNKGNDILNSIREQKIAVSSLERRLKEHQYETYHKFSDIVICGDSNSLQIHTKDDKTGVTIVMEKQIERLQDISWA